ncbi:MAG TPA: serine/threonine-protein kinase [Mycobacteriales bacterium]|nr:serine/threonine-protein kinase [Mycobacteriales bacterium]
MHPSAPPALPGYDVQSLLGSGATGEVWRAVETATGEVVALKRVRAGARPGAADALRQEAAVLRTLDTPHVVRLRAVLGSDADPVLVLDHAAGGSLAALLQRRGTLSPGELVTVAAPLAQALAAAHARGLVHGDVTPSNVLFTADGMPLLSDLGLAGAVGARDARLEGTAEYLDPAVAAGAAPGPPSDVWALAALCHHALAGSPPYEGATVEQVLDAARRGDRAPLGLLAPSAPRALVEAVEAALHVDPAARPDAATFATVLRRAHAAAPVALRGPRAAAPLPAPRETHVVPRHGAAPAAPAARRRPPRWLLPALAAVVLLAGAAGTGVWLGRGSDPAPAATLPAAAAGTPSPAPTPVEAAVDWAAELDALDAARAAAFEATDPARLTAVWAPGSPGLAADEQLVRSLAEAGQSAVGVRHEVVSVGELAREGGTARLRVVDVLRAYELRDVSGEVVRRVPSRGEAPHEVELVRTADGWRLVQVTPL